MRYKMRCVIHDFEYGYNETPECEYVDCPLCLQRDLAEAEEKLTKAVSQRDALLRAFEVKRTVEPAHQAQGQGGEE